MLNPILQFPAALKTRNNKSVLELIIQKPHPSRQEASAVTVQCLAQYQKAGVNIGEKIEEKIQNLVNLVM